MGIVWVRGWLLWVPENPTDSFDGNLQKKSSNIRTRKVFVGIHGLFWIPNLEFYWLYVAFCLKENRCTPLKLHMEHNSEGLEDDFPFQIDDFQVPAVSFPACTWNEVWTLINFFQLDPIAPGSKLLVLGMVIQPLMTGILISWVYKPLLLGWWVYPLLYGNNGSWSTRSHIWHMIHVSMLYLYLNYIVDAIKINHPCRCIDMANPPNILGKVMTAGSGFFSQELKSTIKAEEFFPGMVDLYINQYQTNLGGGFKCFLFSPLPGEMIQFDYYFSDGLKPPTSNWLAMSDG